MANQLVTVREWENFSYERLGGPGSSEVGRLERLVDGLKGDRVLQFHRKHVKAQNQVGILKAGEHTVQILPKIHDDEALDLGFLVHLLSYTRKLGLRGTGPAGHGELAGSLLEFWVRRFAEELNGLLRTRYLQTYVEVEESVGFLRGKLLVERDLEGGGSIYARYPCRYEIFTPDHRINQVLKFCNRLLMRQTRVSRTRAVLGDNDALLADVESRAITSADLRGVHLNRLNRHYEPILEMCRLLLEGSTLELRAGHVTQLAFVFDMNDLFEEFIAEFLKRNKHRIWLGNERRLAEVESQQSLGRIFGRFNMRVDLVLTDSSKCRFLLDTKYKILDSSAKNWGLAVEDFYQMYAYGKASKQQYKDIVLLYPGTGELPHSFEQDGLRVHVRQVDPRLVYDHTYPAHLRSEGSRLAKELGRALRIESEGKRSVTPNGAPQSRSYS
jgi:5-methylcytosine-specific restriction enzyme subunit McrC